MQGVAERVLPASWMEQNVAVVKALDQMLNTESATCGWTLIPNFVSGAERSSNIYIDRILHLPR